MIRAQVKMGVYTRYFGTREDMPAWWEMGLTVLLRS